MIAMALACTPTLLIADEPTTALDVTIQAQILDLMLEMKDAPAAAVLLITHDLGVVAETAQRVVVMYAGRKVEEAPVKALFARPRHPYTRGLMTSIPRLNRVPEESIRPRRLTEIPGMVPSLIGTAGRLQLSRLAARTRASNAGSSSTGDRSCTGTFRRLLERRHVAGDGSWLSRMNDPHAHCVRCPPGGRSVPFGRPGGH